MNNVQEAKLNILDPEFSLIASQAAIELDNAIVGGSSCEFASIQRLSLFLKGAFKSDNPVSPAVMNLDSNAVAVIGSAFDLIDEQHSVKTVPELVKEAWDVAARLEKSSEQNDMSALKQMRTFCIALASSVASYRQSIQDTKPVHPHKR